MRDDIIERLNKIAYSGIDPKRSQIRNYIPDWAGEFDNMFDYDTSPFYPEKYQTLYYDRMCKSILDQSDRMNENEVELLLCRIEDDIKDGYLGFVYDW